MSYLNELVAKGYFPKDFKVEGVFDITNVAEYVYNLKKEVYDFFSDVICFIPPFGRTWFEMTYPAYSYSDDRDPVRLPAGQSSGFLCDYQKREDSFFITVNIFHEYFKKIITKVGTMNEWAGFFNVLTDKFGRPIEIRNDKGEVVMLGGLNQGLINFYQRLAEASGKQRLFSTDCGMGTQGVVITALNFLHCRNVKSRECQYPRKTIKKAIRSGRPYFEKYYTLEIGSIKEKLNKEGKAEEVGLRKAFHICRGHFKTYTDEKPLFGKHVGVFWCPDHTKGDLEIGRIEKHYKLKT